MLETARISIEFYTPTTETPTFGFTSESVLDEYRSSLPALIVAVCLLIFWSFLYPGLN